MTFLALWLVVSRTPPVFEYAVIGRCQMWFVARAGFGGDLEEVGDVGGREVFQGLGGR